MADKLSSETFFAMCVDLDNLVTQRKRGGHGSALKQNLQSPLLSACLMLFL